MQFEGQQNLLRNTTKEIRNKKGMYLINSLIDFNVKIIELIFDMIFDLNLVFSMPHHYWHFLSLVMWLHVNGKQLDSTFLRRTATAKKMCKISQLQICDIYICDIYMYYLITTYPKNQIKAYVCHIFVNLLIDCPIIDVNDVIT